MSSDPTGSSRSRDERGQYVSDVTPHDVLGVFESVAGPTITTSDVVGALDCSRAVARSRLEELADRGLVERRKSGRIVLWWRTDDAAEHPYLGGDGALADTDVPERMRDERERARAEWKDHGNAVSGQ